MLERGSSMLGLHSLNSAPSSLGIQQVTKLESNSLEHASCFLFLLLSFVRFFWNIKIVWRVHRQVHFCVFRIHTGFAYSRPSWYSEQTHFLMGVPLNPSEPFLLGSADHSSSGVFCVFLWLTLSLQFLFFVCWLLGCFFLFVCLFCFVLSF